VAAAAIDATLKRGQAVRLSDEGMAAKRHPSRRSSLEGKETTNVAMGMVKWFNPSKGFGFIKPDDDGPDVFVHVNAVKRAGYSDLLEGARVSYELVTGRNGKQSAENLRIG
jgi:CspA family cold shock protein